MKKLLLALTLIFFCGLTVQAQSCDPDPMLADTTAGVYPLPDPPGSITSVLDTGCVNVGYYQLFTAVVPESIVTDALTGTEVEIGLNQVKVDDIEGLPPGLEDYICNPPDCIFTKNTIGCVAFTGTPTTTGTFFPVVKTTANIELFPGMPNDFPINFPSQETDLVEIYPGEYKVTILEAGSADAACIVSSVDKIDTKIGVRQNTPNPFSTITNIVIDSKESGDFEFKVFSLVGEMVHSENVNFSAGENTITFDGSLLNAGMYFYSIGQGNDVVTKRMVVNR